MKCFQFLLLTCCLQLNAQTPLTAEIEELINGFHKQYTRREVICAPETFDIVYQGTEGSMIATGPQEWHFVFDETLHNVDGRMLPPSYFVVLEENSETKEQESGMLYWMGPLGDAGSKDNVSLAKWLQKRYGSLQQGDSLRLVPAKWFTGSLHALFRPFAYGGKMVSHHAITYQVEQGRVKPTAKGHLGQSHLAYHAMESIASSVCAMQPDGKRLISFDGKRNPKEYKLRSERGLYLFASNVNSQMDKRFLPSELERTYAVMLYLDNWGKAHLYFPSNQSSAEDCLLLALLSNAVETQPAHLFQPLWSAQGAFPAIYLQAKFKRQQWSFTDYRFLDFPE